MQALEFWKTVTVDRGDFLDALIALLKENEVKFCVIGGQAVNAFVDPVVSLDLDLAVALEDLERAVGLLETRFEVERFPHTLHVSAENSKLRVQIQTDPRFFSFPDRSSIRDVLGLSLPVASLEDIVASKVWAASDPGRRGSKRQEDLADLARLLEAYPHLRDRVPEDLRARLL